MKQKNVFTKALSVMLCLVLSAATALMLTACKGAEAGNTDSVASVVSTIELGKGQTEMRLTVIHKNGSQKEFSIHTDETVVGAALLKENLISGDEGQYGLYVTTVDGETLDYNQDQMYWGFYIGKDYAQTGVDQTEIAAGASYTLKAQK